jgi:hypothetical protein
MQSATVSAIKAVPLQRVPFFQLLITQQRSYFALRFFTDNAVFFMLIVKDLIQPRLLISSQLQFITQLIHARLHSMIDSHCRSLPEQHNAEKRYLSIHFAT